MFGGPDELSLLIGKLITNLPTDCFTEHLLQYLRPLFERFSFVKKHTELGEEEPHVVDHETLSITGFRPSVSEKIARATRVFNEDALADMFRRFEALEDVRCDHSEVFADGSTRLGDLKG